MVRDPRRVCEKACYCITSLPECRQWFLPVQDKSCQRPQGDAYGICRGFGYGDGRTTSSGSLGFSGWRELYGSRWLQDPRQSASQHRSDGFQREQPALLPDVCRPAVRTLSAAPVRPEPGRQLWQFTPDNREFSIDQTAQADRDERLLSLQIAHLPWRGVPRKRYPSFFIAEAFIAKAFRFPVRSWPLPGE